MKKHSRHEKAAPNAHDKHHKTQNSAELTNASRYFSSFFSSFYQLLFKGWTISEVLNQASKDAVRQLNKLDIKRQIEVEHYFIQENQKLFDQGDETKKGSLLDG